MAKTNPDLPLVSVVIPIYNVEQYLNESIDSVLAQTYKKLEIILVDDGSPDNSGKIADEYAVKDKRIKVIHKKNGGLSDARNAGIKIATGEYITFIDSDDYVHVKFIDILLDSALGQEIDIVQCNSTRDETKMTTSNKKQRVITGAQAFISLMNYSTILPTAWGKLYKTKLFSENGIKYPIGKKFEDTYTTYKLCYFAKKVSTVEGKLYFYRKNSNSIMSTKINERDIEMVEGYIAQLEQFIRSNDIEIDNRTLSKQKAYRYLSLCQRASLNKEFPKKTYEQMQTKFISNAKDTKSMIACIAAIPVKFPIIFKACLPLVSFMRKSIGNV
jgi:glycosyltransferase involved in cell wall biosynthesis